MYIKSIENQQLPDIDLGKYDYNLPKELIAEFALENRSESKLIYANKQNEIISHHIFKDIENLIPTNSLLIINDTKVISARMNMIKETGGQVEVLCIEPILPSADPQISLMAKSECLWRCMLGGKRVRKGTILFPINKINGLSIKAEVLERCKHEADVRFNWSPTEVTFSEILELFGKTPLPQIGRASCRERV